jgi:hypothetical protein
MVRLDGKDREGKPRTDLEKGVTAFNYGVDMPDVEGMATAIQAVAMSAVGNRLAWLTGSAGKDKTRAGSLPDIITLWTSDEYGRNMKAVGKIDVKRQGFATHEEARAHPFYVYDFMPQFLKWLPDGKRVSFLLRGILYTVPVD